MCAFQIVVTVKRFWLPNLEIIAMMTLLIMIHDQNVIKLWSKWSKWSKCHYNNDKKRQWWKLWWKMTHMIKVMMIMPIPLDGWEPWFASDWSPPQQLVRSKAEAALGRVKKEKPGRVKKQRFVQRSGELGGEVKWCLSPSRWLFSTFSSLNVFFVFSSRSLAQTKGRVQAYSSSWIHL